MYSPSKPKALARWGGRTAGCLLIVRALQIEIPRKSACASSLFFVTSFKGWQGRLEVKIGALATGCEINGWALGAVVSASRLHRVGRGFESLSAHHPRHWPDSHGCGRFLGVDALLRLFQSRPFTGQPAGGEDIEFVTFSLIRPSPRFPSRAWLVQWPVLVSHTLSST